MRALKQLQSIKPHLEKIRSLCIEHPEQLLIRVPAVSGWSVGEHHDHLLKSETVILTTLLRGEPIEGPSINLPGRLVLLSGWIPRGRAEAPKTLIGETRSADEMIMMIDKVLDQLSKLFQSPEKLRITKPVLKHPHFQNLTPEQWIRFLLIHRNHHEKIAREVVRFA